MQIYSNNIRGWLSVDDQHVIAELAKNVKTQGKIVEIGSLMGKSSVAWADNADPSVEIYCIDIFPRNWKHEYKIAKNIELDFLHFPTANVIYNTYDEFKKNTYKYSNIQMIEGYSPTEFTDYNQNLIESIKEIDLLFIDASHKNPNDWDNILYFIPKMIHCGIISGHDFKPWYEPNRFPDVVENVNRLEAMFDTKAIFYPNSSIWTIKLP